MNRRFLSFFLFISISTSVFAQRRPFEHGVNLGYVADYSGQQVFKDVVKEGRWWFHQHVGTTDPWDVSATEPLDLDSLNWPRSLAPGRAAATILQTEQPAPFASGEWICLYDGDGDIEFSWAAREISRTPGRIVLNIENMWQEANEWGPGSYFGIFMKINRTNPENPVRNVRLLRPGTENNYREDPFNPEFIDFIKDFKVLRSMWWNNVIYDSLGWDRRNVPESFTYQTLKGVPYEVIIDLCNRINADAWIAIPVWANDEYVRNLSRLIRDRLNPGLKWYIEHGNETWNGGAYWQQYQYILRRARDLGFREGTDEFTSNQRYHGWRSKQIFEIAEEEFGGTDRIVRVMGSWTGSEYSVGVAMEFDNAHEKTDAVAVAPYFGGGFGSPETIPVVQEWTTEQLLDSLQVDVNRSIQRDLAVRNMVDSYGKRFICYEAGQHLVNAALSGQRQKIDTLFMNVNRHPRMYDLYMEYMTKWEEHFGDVMVHYESISRYSQYGMWGLKEHLAQPESEAPKYRAVKSFMNGTRWTATSNERIDESLTGFALAQNYPNPFNPTTKIRFSLEKAGKTTISVYSLLGQKVATLVNEDRQAGAQEISFSANGLASGIYVVRLEQGSRVHNRKISLVK